jgi:fatty acid desaturase
VSPGDVLTTAATLTQIEPDGDSESTAPDRRYADLVGRVKAARLLERRQGLYLARSAVTLFSLAAGWAAFFLIGNSWWQIVVAVYLAVAFTQLGFLGHDAGHRQAFRSPRANNALLLLCANAGMGIASGWWFGNHVRHHAHPNNTDLDPDVRLRLFAYSHKQTSTKTGIDKFVSRYQHALYFPFLCFLGFSLHIESVLVVLRNGVKRKWLEGSLLVVHFVAFMAAVTLVLSPLRLLAFVLVNQMVFGLYLGSTFAPNHKGMEMYTDGEPTFLDRQVCSSRNVRGGALISYLFGGLNHQIEHHLFPSMPRPNLRKARPIVKSFCEEVGLPYTETSLYNSFRQVVQHFRSTRVS